MAIDLIDTGGGGRDLMGDGSADKGRIRLNDIRFSQITAVQPDVIAPVLEGLEQAGQGYHARYLKVAPEPIAHKREFDSLSVTRIDKDPRILAYNEVMRLMLHSSRFIGCGHPLEARGVEPVELTLSRDATILHDRFANEMARLAGPGERYSAPSVTEVAKKTAERAIRFAGVLYAVDAFAAPLPERDADGTADRRDRSPAWALRDRRGRHEPSHCACAMVPRGGAALLSGAHPGSGEQGRERVLGLAAAHPGQERRRGGRSSGTVTIDKVSLHRLAL